MDATILEAISGDNPSGANLRYEVIYGEIRKRVRMARGEVLLLVDDVELLGADDDWRFVVRTCRDLLKRRSKDLMIAAWLTEAQFALGGFAGLQDGLDILRGLTDKFWETLYPEIEDGDAEARLRVFEWVNTQLSGMVRSSSEAGLNLGDAAEHAAASQRDRDLDACIDSLNALAEVCRKKLGDDALEFADLRDALQGKVRAASDLASILGDLRRAYPAEATPEEFRDVAATSESAPTPPLMPVPPSPPGRRPTLFEWPPPSPSPAAPPSPPMAEAVTKLFVDRSQQKVEFTLTAPATVARGVPFELFVWAHESQERSKILARAHDELGARDMLARTKGPIRISSGTMLSVRLSISGAVIDEPEDTMVWEGESTCVSFVVTLPELNAEAKYAGSAQIYANGVKVAKISFLLSAVGMVEAAGVRYRTAFASYASDDRDAVLGRIQGIHKVAPELEIFLDVLSLRSGQNWEKELWRVIPASDIFYLFWSAQARKSEWVDKEWRCALRERGIEFIDPIPLESPQESPPPPELSSLHFNDWELAFRRGKPSADGL